MNLLHRAQRSIESERLVEHGLLVRFEDHHALVEAIHALRARGYTMLDAKVPYEVEEVEHALAIPRTRITWLAGGVCTLCGALALLLLWWTNAHDYPLNVGGRPYFSFWTDLPITYETMILTCGCTAFVAFFAASGMPRLHHVWFGVEGTEDGFWLAIDGRDPRFDPSVEGELRGVGATAVERYEGVRS